MFENIIICVMMLGAVGLLIAVIVDGIIQDVRSKNELKNHPQFFEDAKALNELIGREIRYFNNKVASLKRLIDEIVAEWDYYPEEMKERKGADLELYRRKYQEEKAVTDSMNRQIDIERERLREYAKQNNIRWW